MTKATSQATSAATGASQATGTQIKVTLVRSLAGQLKSHQATVRGLGLRRIHESAVVEATPEVQGMLRSAQHMLKVEKA